MRRRDLIAAAAGVVAATVVAGGVAWAAIGDGGVIQGCYDSGGNVKVVAAPPCPKGYTPLAWNQQGPQGPPGTNGTNGQNGAPGEPGRDGLDGVSVTGETEPNGTNCPNGGSKFTAVNGITYACNGAPGANGGGSGVASLADLDGIPCQLPGSFGAGSTHLAVGSSGQVTITCGDPKNLAVSVTAHCNDVSCTANRAAVEVATGTAFVGRCEAVKTNPSGLVVTTNCLYSFPVGTNVTLTAEVPAGKDPVWSGDCSSAGSSTVCQLTMSDSKSAGLDYH